MGFLVSYARFVREQYQLIIIATVIGALILGNWSTGAGEFLLAQSSILMFLMIYFMSFTIVPRQFKLIIRKPAGVGMGLGLNFVLMPLICFSLAKLLIHDSDLAAGLILIGVVPCAGMASVWTGLLEGDVPLALSIDATTMLLAPFLMPELMLLLAGSYVHVDVGSMFQKLVLTLLVPVLAEMLTRWFADRFSTIKKEHMGIFPALSATTAVLLMFAICNSAVPMIKKNLGAVPSLLGAVILLFPIAFLAAHLLSRPLFPREQRIAITFSSGMKNLPVAMGVALVSFSKLVGLPIALSFIFQMLTASTAYRLLRPRRCTLLKKGKLGDRGRAQ